MRVDSRTELVIAADIAERLGISRQRVNVLASSPGFPKLLGKALVDRGHLHRHGHLMPGNEAEAVERIDAYLDRANSAARLAA